MSCDQGFKGQGCTGLLPVHKVVCGVELIGFGGTCIGCVLLWEIVIVVF